MTVLREEETMQTVKDPITKDILVAALKKIGVGGDMIVEVHASLSSFHYVVGGARTVVDSLMEVCNHGGTILMPTQTADNSEPSDWVNPAIEANTIKAVRKSIPPYHGEYSDIPGIGEVAENFRHRQDVIVSRHPHVSYAAWGRYAKLLCNRQSMHFPLAEESPCARLYELKGKVLLLGTDFDTVTCMHLAEYRNDCRPIGISGSCVNTEEGPIWKKYLDLNIDSSTFLKVRPLMQRKNMIREIMLGGSHIQFFSATDAIDETMRYLEKYTVYDLYR